MYLIIAAIVVAGAFAIVAAAAAMPISPWLSHVGALPHAEFAVLRPGMKAERAPR
jgi:hypothetical protein